MLRMFIIFALFLAKTSLCQKVSLANYDNITDIDNYWGEIDSLLLRHKITVVETYIMVNSLQLRQVDHYKDGRKTKMEEGYLNEGIIERQIFYTYSPKKLEAKLIHYSSKNRNSKFPPTRFDYLARQDDEGKTYSPYARDSAGNVIMTIAHNWLPNGDIFFESFDRAGVLIDSVTMHRNPDIEPEQVKPARFPMKTGEGTEEEKHYDRSGKIVYIRDCHGNPCVEFKYTYDPNGFLVKLERFVAGTLRTTTIYKYK